MHRLQRVLRAVAVFFFVGIPVWIWRNVILAGLLQVYTSFRAMVRANALWIILGSFVLLLVATEQFEVLNLLFTYGLAIALLIFGFRVMVKGLPGNKKKKRR